MKEAFFSMAFGNVDFSGLFEFILPTTLHSMRYQCSDKNEGGQCQKFCNVHSVIADGSPIV